MADFLLVTLTWKQLKKLEQYMAALKTITYSPKGELKNGEGNITIEWDEAEVKFNLPE